MDVTVLTTPTCKRCDLTKHKLNREEIPYTALNAEDHPDLVRQAKQLGHHEAPVIFVHDNAGNLTHHWSGFRPALIEKLHAEQTIEPSTWPPRGTLIEAKTGLERLPDPPRAPAMSGAGIEMR